MKSTDSSNIKTKLQVIKKLLIRTVLAVTALLFILMLTAVLVIRIPSVQRYLINKSSTYLTNKIGYPITIERIDLNWFDTPVFEGINVEVPVDYQMLAVKKIEVDMELSSLIFSDTPKLDYVLLDGVEVDLRQDSITSTLNLNDFLRAVNRAFGSKTSTDTSASAAFFGIDEVELKNCTFMYDDRRRDSITDGFDYYHFALTDINGTINSLRIHADTFEIDVKELTGKDRATGLKVHEITTLFRVTKSNMNFDRLHARIGKSRIARNLTFHYNNIDELNDFIELIVMESDLNNTSIYSKDLALFAPSLKKYDEYWTISGHFKGKVDKFSVDGMNLGFGDGSRIKGKVFFEGLPEFQETFMDFDLTAAHVEARDLYKYVDKQTARFLRKIEKVDFSGKFTGFPLDFVAYGRFQSPVGYVKSDVNFKLADSKNSSYSGNLLTKNLKLGYLADNRELGYLDMNGYVEGKGFTTATADVKLNSTISRLGFRNYNYRNIDTDARFSKKRFYGSLSIADPHLKADLLGNVNLESKPEVVSLSGDITRVDFKNLRLSNEDIHLAGRLDVNFLGINIDSIVGNAAFKDIVLSNAEDSLHIFNISAATTLVENERILTLESDKIKMSAVGNYTFMGVYNEFYYLLNKHIQTWERTLQSDNQKRMKQQLTFELQTGDLTTLANIFSPQIKAFKNIKLNGTFESGQKTAIICTGEILKFSVGNIKIDEAKMETASFLTAGQLLLNSTTLTAKNLYSGDSLLLKNILAESVSKDSVFRFFTTADYKNAGTSARLKGRMNVAKDYQSFTFYETGIKILGNMWTTKKENMIVVKGKEVTVSNLVFQHAGHSVAVNGAISTDSAQSLNVHLTDFDPGTLNSLIQYKLRGNMNGDLKIRDVYGFVTIESNAEIKRLTIDNFPVGNVKIKSNWDQETKKLPIEVSIDRDQPEMLKIKGYYDPTDSINSLNLLVYLNKTELNILEPFAKDYVSGISGTASGALTMRGTLKSPIVTGALISNKGKFKLNYLNTIYSFNDRIVFDENLIGCKNLKLYDGDGHTAVLNGGIYHDGFKNFIFDLSGTVKNFQVMNTEYEDNTLYFGTAYATGDFNIFGTTDDIKIKSTLRSDKNTKIYIPLSGYRGVAQEDHIIFINETNKLKLLKENQYEKMKLNGIKLDFNFDITPDAYCEIIFDIKAGDIIRAYGNGRIRMEIDTKGDFNMYGEYIINKGSYNFTLLNIINKEFLIKKGGNISWNGSPYQGLINIDAEYKQNVPLRPILNLDTAVTNKQNIPQLNRRYPVSVELNLKGDLMTPVITYNINITDYPNNISTPQGSYSVQNDVRAFLNSVKNDQAEMNRQVFSLLIMKQLSPPLQFVSTFGTSAGNSVSELLSNQLNYWMSQVDDNLEIDVNLNGLDADALNTFRLRVSYSLLDGRLRITRDGSFTNTQTNQANLTSIAGEWTVEYLLEKEGRLRIKMYNKTNLNAGVTALEQNSSAFSAGLSLLHTQNFDNIMDLLTGGSESESPKQIPDAPVIDKPAQKPEEEE